MNNINVRMLIYVLSPLLTMAAPLLAGYGVTLDAEQGILSIHLETLFSVAGGGLLGGFAISKGVLAKWGKR